MAMMIASTPVLSGNKANKFITKINEDAKRPVSLVPTPKLGQVADLIKKHATKQQKHNR
jgi:hypothetical protein